MEQQTPLNLTAPIKKEDLSVLNTKENKIFEEEKPAKVESNEDLEQKTLNEDDSKSKSD